MFKKFKLEKSIWSFTPTYTITDELDVLQYEAKRFVFKWAKVAELFDAMGQHLLTIRTKPFSWKSTYFIDIDDVPTYRFVKSFRLKDRIFVDSLTEADAFIIEGNFWSNEYKFIQKDCEFAYVSKKMWSMRDSYGIAIDQSYDPAIIISCVIMIDNIKEKQRSAAG